MRKLVWNVGSEDDAVVSRQILEHKKNWSLLSFDVFRIRYFFNCMLQRYPHRNFDFVKETMPQRCCQYSSNCSAVPFDCVFMWIVFISSSKNSLPTETSIAINVMCTRNNCGPWKTKLFQVHFIEDLFYRGMQMQNAKITWYAFHFLSLRLLIGIPGQAFLGSLEDIWLYWWEN